MSKEVVWKYFNHLPYGVVHALENGENDAICGATTSRECVIKGKLQFPTWGNNDIQVAGRASCKKCLSLIEKTHHFCKGTSHQSTL